MADLITAFTKTAEDLAHQLKEAAVDHAAFEKRLPLCELSKCRATCCHDGVILSDEEAEVLKSLGAGEELFQERYGFQKTKTVAAQSRQIADDFPAHFPKTRCVFLDEEHRCQWQLRAVEEGRHPWFYKPTSCWMHPVLLTQQDDRPFLTILSPGKDRQQFASKTPCGREKETADEARISLKGELEMLARISGRDFVRELNAPGIEG